MIYNIFYVDCPVSGGTEGAEKGSLSLFVRASKKDCLRFEVLNPLRTNTVQTVAIGIPMHVTPTDSSDSENEESNHQVQNNGDQRQGI